MEKWKEIKGYEGRYEVSSLGNVRSISHFDKNGHYYKGRIRKLTRGKQGYMRVRLSLDDSTVTMSVHRLVAAAFIDNPNGYNVVNHLDNNTSNNNFNNLEWVTYKGNMQYAAKQGRMHGCTRNLKKAQESNKIKVIAKKGKFVKRYDSEVEAGKELGVSRGHISAACRKEYGYKKLKGYEFEYADKALQNSLSPKRIGKSQEQLKRDISERMKGNKIMLGRHLSEETKNKLSEAKSKAIIQFTKEGLMINEYKSAAEATKLTGITHVDDCASKKRKSAGGYLWRWKNE